MECMYKSDLNSKIDLILKKKTLGLKVNFLCYITPLY